MAEDSTTPPPPPHQRRSSFAGQTFADLFGTGNGRQRPSIDPSNNSPPNQQYGPISQAAAQAQRRRMSITTLGLSGSSEGPRLPTYRGRHDSIGSSNSGSLDESAIEDDNAAREPTSTPVTPFARRMSFGAKALRDVRQSSGGGGGGGGGSNGQNGTKSPPATSANTTANANAKAQNGTISARDAKGRGLSSLQHHPLASSSPSRHHYSLSLPVRYSSLTHGPALGSVDFWNENMRNRAQRTSMAGGQSGEGLPTPSVPPTHSRSKSMATMEAPAVREVPREPNRPDHFQERILKGDFYMD